jgi:hypothetical protein
VPRQLEQSYIGYQMRLPQSWKRAVLLIVVSVVSAVTAALADDAVTAAVLRLLAVDKFAFGGVGYAGVTSKGEVDFKVLLAQPEPTALNAFEKLYATGNPQGKSYALSGIKKLNPKRFKELKESIANSTEEVEVMRGCIVSHEALRDVAKQIDQGKFRF